MFSTKSALLLLAATSLSLVACVDGQLAEVEEERLEQEEASRVELHRVVRLGGPLLAEVELSPGAPLPACNMGDLCSEEVGGCCELEGNTLCFSCAAPVQTVCNDDADCGDADNLRCELDEHGQGTCFELCGGIDGLECAAGALCMKPIELMAEEDALGTCRTLPEQVELSSLRAVRAERRADDTVETIEGSIPRFAERQ